MPAAGDEDHLLPPGPRWLHRVDLVVMAVIAAVAVVSRFATRSPLWLDEALSVNIARLPLGQIAPALRHDGHPPLYYVLLHAWMAVFGTGDMAVRALSGLFALALFPLMYVAGRRLGGRRVGMATVLVVAVSPFAIRYATEARMYTLVMVLVVAAWLVGEDALREPTARRLVALALLVAALLWTHYWSFWLLGAVGIATVGRWWLLRRHGESTRARSTLLVLGALGGGVALFLPWLPVLAYQSSHTGTPWGGPVRPTAVLATAIADLGGGANPEAILTGIVLTLLVVIGLSAVAVSGHRLDVDVRVRPPVRRIALVAALTLVVAELASYATGAAFQSRYLAVVVPFVWLVAGRGLGQVTGPAAFRVLAATVVGLGLAGAGRNFIVPRTQARQAAQAIAASGRAGDLVVVCPDQLGPALRRELRGFRIVTEPLLGSPERVDWVDYQQRLDRNPPAAVARRILAAAGNRRVWLVWSTGYKTHEERCPALVRALQAARPRTTVALTELSDRYEKESVYRFDP
ncbi:MAG: glycosyltransferase family 39 protein [Actinobacteria bacterium]|nr:glycosyltransferase family 39 protein [Actinomycetota bacterium]